MGSILGMMRKREGGSVWKGETSPAPQHTPVSPSSAKPTFTFSWLKESILFMAVSKAVTISRKPGSCSHRGLDSRSEEILTADLDMAEGNGSGEHAKESREGHVPAAAWWDSHPSPGWLLHPQRVTAGKNQGLQPPGRVQHNFPGRYSTLVERKERKSHQFIHVNTQRTVFIEVKSEALRCTACDVARNNTRLTKALFS